MNRTTARNSDRGAAKQYCSMSSFHVWLAKLGHRAMAAVLSALLTFQPALVKAQQITADPASGANQPGVGTAPNGVPLIDIVAPNSQGLSHNKYDSFNVGTPGVILNNYNAEVGTSNLGGVTPGNPNLRSSGPATVILNEVTKQNRSALEGPVEVFGGRADVVIANPNGITCNGCGFINTPRATLTTGTPNIGTDGRLSGFTVNGGDVTFGTRGGNFASGQGGVDLFDVVSRTVRIDGPVYGKDLRLTAGRNKFEYATGGATALTATSGTPEFAIDGSALGAMQADRIKIVVTEKGAGVRMRGDLAANAGELSLSADGRISIGNASGNLGVDIRSKAKVEAGKIASKRRVVIAADQGISLQSVAADDNVELTGGSGLISINAEASTSGSIQLTSAGGVQVGSVDAGNGASLTSSSGDIKIGGTARSAGDLVISASAGSITAASLVSFGNLLLIAGQDIGVTGDILAARDLNAAAASITGGAILSGVDISATSVSPSSQVIFSTAGDMSLVARSGGLNAVNIGAAGDLNISAAKTQAKNIAGRKDINLTGDASVSGQILGARNVHLSGQTIVAGTVISGVDFKASNASPTGAIVIGSTGDLVIDATSSGAVNSGTLLSAGAVDLVAKAFTAQNVTGHHYVHITADTDVSGQILSGSDVSVSGAGIRASAIVSGVDFAATTKSPSGDVVLRNTGNIDLVASSRSIDVGTLLAAGSLTVYAAQNITANAVSHQALSLTAGNAINLTRQSLSGADAVLKAASVTVDTLLSGVDFAASAASPTGNLILRQNAGSMSLDASQGSIVANALISALDLNAHAAKDISYSSLQSFGSVGLAADQGSISLDKATRAQGDITLTAISVDLSGNRGQIATAKDLIINAVSASFAGSNLTYGGLLLNLTGNADFTATTLNAVTNNGGSGNIGVKATTILTNSATALLAQNDLTLTVASLSNPGQLAAGHDLAITVSADLTNNPTGLLYSGNDAKLYVAGNLLNDQGAIMAGHDLAIAAGATGAKSQSVTNISGLIRAENDVSIVTESLTNRRLTTPTWENVLVSDGDIIKFQINPEAAGKPVAQLFQVVDDKPWLKFYPDLPKLGYEWASQLYGVITLADGSSYRTRGITAPDGNMPWNWGDSLHSDAEMIDWLSKRTPKNPDGTPFLDPVNPTKAVILHNKGDQFAWTFTWDDDTQLRQTIHEDRLTSALSPEAMIHAGGDLTVEATTLNNSYSSIEAGGDATLKGSVLNNEGVTFHRTTLTKCEAKGGCEAYDSAGNRDATKDLGDGVSALTGDVAIGGVGGSIKAAGALDVSGYASVNNTSTPGSMASLAVLVPSAAPGDPTSALTGLTAAAALFTPNAAFAKIGAAADASTIAALKASLANSIPKPNSGGFGGTVPGQVFVYETRAAFLDVGKFYGSAYFINRIGYTPDHEIPFLGDAYFENQLIDNELRQLVGQGLGKGSFIPGSDAIEQMKLLLDNGIEYAKAHNLAMGEKLSPEQAAALTKSMVVYETKVVDGIEVLAPVVYLANIDKSNLTAAGALMSGGSVDMNVGDLQNSGAIVAKSDLKLNAGNIKANGGSFVAGGNVEMTANSLTLGAQSLDIGGTDVLNPNGGVKAGGNAKLTAKDDLTLQGAQISAGADVALAAKNVIPPIPTPRCRAFRSCRTCCGNNIRRKP